MLMAYLSVCFATLLRGDSFLKLRLCSLFLATVDSAGLTAMGFRLLEGKMINGITIGVSYALENEDPLACAWFAIGELDCPPPLLLQPSR